MPVTRHQDAPERGEVWAQIAAPLPASAVQWRQQGKPKPRDGKFFAPFVAYIDAQFVRDRLDAVVPGEWDLTLEMLPPLVADGNGEANDEPVAFKARLQILGTIREDVGSGKDYKTASTDAFKRAAVRFGIGHELYTDYEILWCEVDADSKYARPVEDPQQKWMNKVNRTTETSQVKAVAGEARSQSPVSTKASATPPAAAAAPSIPVDGPSCPKCGGRMWDNRLSKKNPKAPDYKCRSRSCDGVVWPPKNASPADDAPPPDEPHPGYDESLGF